METSTPSPAKRMALAPIDANMKSPSCTPRAPGKLMSTLKRALAPSEGSSEAGSGRSKKACLDTSAAAASTRAEQPDSSRPQLLPSGYISARTEGSIRSKASRPASRSPEPIDSADSSIFYDDQSSQDITQLTNLTEPDLPAAIVAGTGAMNPALHSSPPPPQRRRAMTREEARIKAEMLRLRLGLASYKVKTGQTEIPLERLQRKPFAPTRQDAIFARARSSSSAATMTMARNAMQMAASMSPATAPAGPMSDPPVPSGVGRHGRRTEEDADDAIVRAVGQSRPERSQAPAAMAPRGFKGLQPAQPIRPAS